MVVEIIHLFLLWLHLTILVISTILVQMPVHIVTTIDGYFNQNIFSSKQPMIVKLILLDLLCIAS